MIQRSIVPIVLAGRCAPLGKGGQASGIAKVRLQSAVRITPAGLVGDEVADLKRHGGADKALHHYPFDHYAAWQDELGPHPLLLEPGAFGENLSTQGWTEAQVHVGDIMQWDQVRLQVSQGRQPCWKLNERFGIRDMAWQVQSSGRTGWYYRVLEGGIVEPGAPLIFLERPQPNWPLSRLLRLVFRDTRGFAELEEMAAIPELSVGWRNLATKRLATRTCEDWTYRLAGGGS